MDKNEKLAMARKKLKKFQARNSPQAGQEDNSVGLSFQSKVTHSVNTPLTTPTLVGAAPLANHFPTSSLHLSTAPSTAPLPSTSLASSNNRAALSSKGISTTSAGLSASPRQPQSSLAAPLIDLALPLTSLSLTQNSSIDYSLPSLISRVSNDQGPTLNLNGSIQEHLSPLSILPPPDMKSEPPVMSPSDDPPPYGAGHTHIAPVVRSTAVGPFTSSYTEGLPLGATQGGVLLKHIPYLPSLANSLGVESGAWPVESRLLAGGEENISEGASTGTNDIDSKVSVMGEEITELEQKVKAHAQTIDILVSEKSALQMELGSLKTQLASKASKQQQQQQQQQQQ